MILHQIPQYWHTRDEYDQSPEYWGGAPSNHDIIMESSWNGTIQKTSDKENRQENIGQPNGGFLKWWYSSIIHFFIGFSNIDHPFWGIPIYTWKTCCCGGEKYDASRWIKILRPPAPPPLWWSRRWRRLPGAPVVGGFVLLFATREKDQKDQHAKSIAMSQHSDVAMYTFFLGGLLYYSWTCSDGIWDMKKDLTQLVVFHHPPKVQIT